ncbi:MAG: hypothetical protein ACR2OZ_06745 [Verrucomicrobiales bacterium]
MTQPTLIRSLLVGLPAGLIVLGVIAVILYYHPLGSPRSRGSASSVTAQGKRRPILEKDLRDYVRVIEVEIGPRPPSDAAQLDRTARWIESTLGPSNIGFQVRNEGVEVAGQRVQNLSVDVPGQDRGVEVVVVATHYHSGVDSPAHGTAALLSLANAMIGQTPKRTLRFAWWGARTSEAGEGGAVESGGQPFLASCKARGERVNAVVQLCGLFFAVGHTSRADPVLDGGRPSPAPTGEASLFFGGDKIHAPFVDEMAGVFARRVSMPVERMFFSDRGTSSDEKIPAPKRGRVLPGGKIPAWPPAEVSLLLVDGFQEFDYPRFMQIVLGLEEVLRHLGSR